MLFSDSNASSNIVSVTSKGQEVFLVGMLQGAPKPVVVALDGSLAPKTLATLGVSGSVGAARGTDTLYAWAIGGGTVDDTLVVVAIDLVSASHPVRRSSSYKLSQGSFAGVNGAVASGSDLLTMSLSVTQATDLSSSGSVSVPVPLGVSHWDFTGSDPSSGVPVSSTPLAEPHFAMSAPPVTCGRAGAIAECHAPMSDLGMLSDVVVFPTRQAGFFVSGMGVGPVDQRSDLTASSVANPLASKGRIVSVRDDVPLKVLVAGGVSQGGEEVPWIALVDPAAAAKHAVITGHGAHASSADADACSVVVAIDIDPGGAVTLDTLYSSGTLVVRLPLPALSQVP